MSEFNHHTETHDLKPHAYGAYGWTLNQSS